MSTPLEHRVYADRRECVGEFRPGTTPLGGSFLHCPICGQTYVATLDRRVAMHTEREMGQRLRRGTMEGRALLAQERGEAA